MSVIHADTQHVPAEGHQSFFERILGTALRVGVAVGAVALLAANLISDGLQMHAFDGDVYDPLLGDANYE